MNILEINGLTKVYKGKKAIQNISLTIKKGEIIGLVGPNGAGKTTLMKIIVGITRNYKGKVIFHQTNAKKRTVGCIIENPSFYPNLTGMDNLRYFAEFSGGYNEKEVTDIIQMLNMGGFIHKKVKNYSLGMKQRLGLAQALLNEPELLILDEPTNGLDPEGVVEIRNIIRAIVQQRQISVLISSHILSEIEIICDQVAFLQNGNLVEMLNLKAQSDSDKIPYKIETTVVSKVKQALLQLNVQVKETAASSIVFEASRNEIENVILQVIQMGGRFSAIYPVQHNLESKFFDLLGGNKIG